MKLFSRLVAHRVYVLLFLTYAYFYQGGDPNQGTRYWLAVALVDRHAPDITPNHAAILDKSYHDGKYFSDKAPGISFLAVVPYAIMRTVDRVTHLDSMSRPVERARLHVLSILFSALAGAASAFYLARILARFGMSRSVTLVVTLGYALGTLVFPFSTVLFGHQTSAALLLIGFDRALRLCEAQSFRLRDAIGIGALFGLSTLVEYPSGLLAACIVGYLAVSFRARVKDLARGVAIGVAPFVVLHMAFAYWAFGNPFALPYRYMAEPMFLAHTSTGFLGIRHPTALGVYGVFFSRYRGLFYYCPFMALTFAGFAVWLRSGERPREVRLCAVMGIAYTIFATSYYAWDGGASTGPRHLVPVLAFSVVPIAYFARWSRRAFAVTCALAGVSSLIMLASVSVLVQMAEGDPYRADPLYMTVLPSISRSELSMNQQDVYLAPRDILDAAYNLGTLLRLPPLASLAVPLVAWALMLLSLRHPRAQGATT